MIRFLAAIAIFVGTLTAQEQLNPPIVVQAAPQPTGPSLVAFAQNSAAMRDFDEDPAVTRTMVDALIRTVTGKSDIASAWRTLVESGDRVGIKVTTAGGPLFATRRGVVAAVVAGLKDAGVKNIFVWDKSAAALKECGFTPERIDAIKQMHRLLNRRSLTLAEAQQQIVELSAAQPASAADIGLMLDFLATAQRGIVR